MKLQNKHHRSNGTIADLKVRIIHQQEVASKLFRAGKKEEARRARNNLIVMLNLLEIHSSFHSPNAATSSMERTTA